MCQNYQYLLIVDDHDGVRRLLFEIFSNEGYNIELAASGAEALRKVRFRIPALILLDARMPGMSGLETLHELKKLIPCVPVILVTAYTEMNILREAKNRGLVKYEMKKPFDLDEVRNLVRTILAENKVQESLNNQETVS